MPLKYKRGMQILGASAVILLSACGSTPSKRPCDCQAAFAEALRDCRLDQPGRVNRRLSLSPDSPGVEMCLAHFGWAPSGIKL